MSTRDADEVDLEPEEPSPASSSGFALGFVAAAPLFLAYEIGLAAAGAATRSSAELVVFRAASVLGEQADLARRGVLAGALVWALVALRRERALLPRLAGVVLTGALAAVVLGPLLLALIHFGGAVDLGALRTRPLPPPGLARAGLLLGGAAYEELLFRAGLYPLLFVVLRRGLASAGASSAAFAVLADAVALVGSAALFAAFHLDALTRWLGGGGEAFSAPVFTWRLAAGILLGLLFPWRGIGVAAWAHGIFNLALSIGAGPDVFL